MQQKSTSPLMALHLAMMLLAAVVSLIGVITCIAAANSPEIHMYYVPVIVSMYLLAVMYILHILALVCCIIYTHKGYSKDAAFYYKAIYILLIATSVLGGAVAILYQGVGISVTLSAMKLIPLILLLGEKDLGKQNSLILFCVLLGIDIALCFQTMGPATLTPIKFGSIAARLLVDGTLGLAIRGKFADKAARGRR